MKCAVCILQEPAAENTGKRITSQFRIGDNAILEACKKVVKERSTGQLY